AQWADSTLFWAAMGYNLGPKGAASMFKDAPAGTAEAFAKDRGAMRAGMPRLPEADATAAYRSYLRRLADSIDYSPFLLGDAPCVADFAAYHPLWFSRVRNPAMAGIFEPVPQLLEWMDRVAAIGHGKKEKLDPAAAIAIAKDAMPAEVKDEFFQDEHGIALGSKVTVTAESFGHEPTEGELVAASRTFYVLRRTDDRAGTVHVHFPRIGFILGKADPS
ncbi:MAG: glutathione S-transferase C-terminal domain-containing protein, partial [Burkholderiales bacterium]